MSIRKRKEGGNYYIDLVINGHRIVQSAGTPVHREAVKIHDTLRAQLMSQKLGIAPSRRKTIQLFPFIDKVLDKARQEQQPSTVALYTNYFNKFKAIIGNKYLHEIDVEDIDRWKSIRLSTVCATTFNIERRTLQAVFNTAIKWEYLEKNVFKQIPKLRVQEKRLFLTGDEIRRVLEAIDKDIEKYELIEQKQEFKNIWTKKHVQEQIKYNKLFRQFIILALNTGLRREEQLHLQWSDVDFDRNVLHIQKTKDKKTRTVPLTNVARSILKEIEPSLFSNLTKSNVSKKFHKYLEQAGITGMKLHSLRHTFATMLITSGVDLYTVSRLLGHSDIRTTMIYAKVQTEVLQEAITKLNLCYKNVTRKDQELKNAQNECPKGELNPHDLAATSS